VQASKLAALGQMAAGITHELNQPLAALRTFSDNTRVLLERGQLDAATGNLSAIADLTERMGKITGQLKLFAGKARQRRNAVRVRAALDHVLQLMAPRLGVMLRVRGLDGDAADLAVGRRTEARTGAAEPGRQRARRHCRRRPRMAASTCRQRRTRP
jgi:two-component system C4-dicarboxylate transport sensor histidine kinase DctB